MEITNKRNYARKNSLHILDYVLLDEKGESVGNSMGRMLNVSQKGLLLETHTPITKGQTLLMTIGLKEKLVKLKGVVTHAEELKKNTFSSGVEFTDIDKSSKRKINKFLNSLKTEINN